MHLAIRADGGPTIGYGHLVRSGALAEEFLERGHNVTFATTTPEHVTDVCPTDVETVTLPKRDDPTPFVAWLETETPDVVFTDAYPVDTDYQREIREQVPLAVLQDDARHAVCADLFVNGNLNASSLEYDYVDSKPKTCLGTRYVLLRREIRDLASQNPPWRENPEQALITMGGSDTANLTPTVVRSFDGLDLRVDAIVGPGFTENQEQEIRDAGANVSADVRVARDPENLPERMFQADFAVSTASSTTYELLALGTPFVTFAVVDNQEQIAASLQEYDIATVLGWRADDEKIKNAIKTYSSNTTLRREHRERGRNLVDGNGTERIANKMVNLGRG
ncbi:UDP-2,4-diacetamido-2,4,6-trideoxy-beta-L-altropyranose hydrolase [Haladaptatus sp. DJG-WS-42]|uniref:UDP-2,4-diacetamido-2,4, 6-trideoxy-beta-L-altropyranose hydrolase n=1 Tax=Haladaptatus sp. DJG-WS-42 TaxID=3120516 RepID=UPI0030CC93D8